MKKYDSLNSLIEDFSCCPICYNKLDVKFSGSNYEIKDLIYKDNIIYFNNSIGNKVDTFELYLKSFCDSTHYISRYTNCIIINKGKIYNNSAIVLDECYIRFTINNKKYNIEQSLVRNFSKNSGKFVESRINNMSIKNISFLENEIKNINYKDDINLFLHKLALRLDNIVLLS